MCWMQVVPAVGLEPTTFALQERCCYQLSYAGKRRFAASGLRYYHRRGIGPDMLSVRQSHHYAGVAQSQLATTGHPQSTLAALTICACRLRYSRR